MQSAGKSRRNRPFENGAPGGIRTPDHLVRSQVLYPTELRARGLAAILLHPDRPEGLLGPSWASALRAQRCALSKIAPGDFVEPPTTWFEARYSIQLSYGRAAACAGHSTATQAAGYVRRSPGLASRSCRYPARNHDPGHKSGKFPPQRSGIPTSFAYVMHLEA